MLIVHGGAGCGKSKLIHEVAYWTEYIMSYDANKDPECPSVIKCAPTGKAACVIDGMTMHSAFGFTFTSRNDVLPDRKREELRGDAKYRIWA